MSVPATAVWIGGIACTPDGAVYVQMVDGATSANPSFTGTVTASGATFSNFAQNLNTLTPANNAAITVDWAYGATKVTNQGTNVATFSNVPAAGIVGHVLDVSNLSTTTFPAATDWGVSGKPVIAGRAVVILQTNDGGTKVFATVSWQAV